MKDIHSNLPIQCLLNNEVEFFCWIKLFYVKNTEYSGTFTACKAYWRKTPNCCLRSNKRISPNIWNISGITLIYKDGDKTLILNYRSMNLLCCLSKVFEELLFDNIYRAVNHLFFDSQFGFTPQRSTIFQKLCFLNKLDQNKAISGIDELFVFHPDILKAFDTVPHYQVIEKLAKNSRIGENAL